MKILTLILALFLFFSCVSQEEYENEMGQLDSEEEVIESEELGESSSDELVFEEEQESSGDDEVIEDDSELVEDDSELKEDPKDEPQKISEEKASEDEVENLEVVAKSKELKSSSSDEMIHIAKEGETLMQIGFHYYGDYRMWKELVKLNSDILNKNLDIKEGMRIRLVKGIMPPPPSRGKPYLVRRNDTLSIISKKVYGDESLWPQIWSNNAKQIRDPNLIFEGFTLFIP